MPAKRMQWSYLELRRRLIEAELWPRGRMSRLACYLAGSAIVLYALRILLGLFAPSWGANLGGWVGSLAGVRKRDPAWQRRHLGAWYGNKPLPLCNDFGGASLTYPEFMKGSFQDMVHDGGQLYLRVGSSMQVAGNTLTVVTGEPFDKDLVSKIASHLGEITLYTPAIKKDSGSKPPAPASSSAGSSLSATADQDRNKLVITKGNANDREELPARFTVGAVPESSGSFDREITFGTPLPVTEWKTGAPQQVLAVLPVTTRPA